MPELPEVETIARILRNGIENVQPSLLSQTIIGCSVFWKRTIAFPALEAFSRKLIGEKIVNIGRRGKYLILTLTQYSLIYHLRMSGDLRFEPSKGVDGTDVPFEKHDRLMILFDNAYRLVFNDTRKFGRVWLVPDVESVVGKLGPEPLSESFQPDLFFLRLHKHHRMIKSLLLDQHFLAGLGNIYSDEALFLAGLHPKRKSDTLDRIESMKLYDSIRLVLKEGIEHNGASIDWVYRGGDFQNHFRVYQRTGKVCYSCGNNIERIVLGQRSTHYCPICQPNMSENCP